MKKINQSLKLAMLLEQDSYEIVAKHLLKINRKVFLNKINHTKVNGYEARFKDSEKELLARHYKIPVEDIE